MIITLDFRTSNGQAVVVQRLEGVTFRQLMAYFIRLREEFDYVGYCIIYRDGERWIRYTFNGRHNLPLLETPLDLRF